MLDWLRKLFVGEKGVASTPEVVTPVHPTVSQEEINRINKELEKILDETSNKEPIPVEEQNKELTKAQESDIKNKQSSEIQSTSAKKSRSKKSRAKDV